MDTEIPYHHPLIRDLAWALSSPPLLQRADRHVFWPGNDWFSAIGGDYGKQLADLENEPGVLQNTVDSGKDRRLGGYFETLWRFWLGSNEQYRLLFTNLPVRSDERTIGEFDFLVKDLKTGKTLHWELAVKFYLGINDTSQTVNWWGPAQRDRLDIKMTRLLEHQSRLSRYPQARQLLKDLDIRVDETWLILKGRLFYPAVQNAIQPDDAHPAHLKGFWMNRDLFLNQRKSLWLVLERHQWLAPVARIDSSQCRDNQTLVEQWEKESIQHPLCIARISHGMETQRGFIVPDNWSRRIAQSSNPSTRLRP